MAITAATVAVDSIFIDNNNLKSIFPAALPFISTSSSWVQGDNLCWDTSSHLLRAVTSDADGATFAGVAQQSITNGIPVGPYPSGVGTVGSQKLQQIAGPAYGCVANRKVIAGDSLTPGCRVYLPVTSDTQTVTITDATSGGDEVGIYQGPAVTAVAGTLYPILVGYRGATGDTLQY